MRTRFCFVLEAKFTKDTKADAFAPTVSHFLSGGASALLPRQQAADRMSESAGPAGRNWTYSVVLICQLIGCQGVRFVQPFIAWLPNTSFHQVVRRMLRVPRAEAPCGPSSALPPADCYRIASATEGPCESRSGGRNRTSRPTWSIVELLTDCLAGVPFWEKQECFCLEGRVP